MCQKDNNVLLFADISTEVLFCVQAFKTYFQIFMAIQKIKLGSQASPRPLKHLQNPCIDGFYYGQNPEFFCVRSETDLVLMESYLYDLLF